MEQPKIQNLVLGRVDPHQGFSWRQLRVIFLHVNWSIKNSKRMKQPAHLVTHGYEFQPMNWSKIKYKKKTAHSLYFYVCAE